jgi:hypothetical protein
MEPISSYLADPSLSYAYVMYGFNIDRYFHCWLSLGLLCFIYRYDFIVIIINLLIRPFFFQVDTVFGFVNSGEILGSSCVCKKNDTFKVYK